MSYYLSQMNILKEKIRYEKTSVKLIRESIERIGKPTGEYSLGYTDALKMELLIHQKMLEDAQEELLKLEKERNK